MSFDPGIEAFIKSFVKDLAEKNVAIFAGAGMSKSQGFVDWPHLLKDIADELGLNVDKEHDLISLAQYHVNDRGSRAGINRKILEEFSHQAEPSENHRILARLPIPTFWTTNYDTLLEDALKQAFRVVDLKHREEQLAATRPKRDVVVYKMHGDVNSSDLAVLTKDDYEAYYKTHPAFITALSADLVTKTFLFIGFSFTDPNLDYVMSRLNGQRTERQHYCFMKRETKGPNDDEETLAYKRRKQELRVNDLKRYKIKALLVDEYQDITKILLEIERRFRKQTVFISGSAEDYGRWSRLAAQELIHRISCNVITSGCRVVNGFGWGVGSAVINGALEAIYGNQERYSEDQLIIRPFPQYETGTKKLPELWEEYRQRMISLSGIAIFVFGNKLGADGSVVPANGVQREFEIALELGAIPIPIAATGFMAEELFNEIAKDPVKVYGSQADYLFPLVKELADDNLSATEIASKVAAIVQQLNR